MPSPCRRSDPPGPPAAVHLAEAIRGALQKFPLHGFETETVGQAQTAAAVIATLPQLSPVQPLPRDITSDGRVAAARR